MKLEKFEYRVEPIELGYRTEIKDVILSHSDVWLRMTIESVADLVFDAGYAVEYRETSTGTAIYIVPDKEDEYFETYEEASDAGREVKELLQRWVKGEFNEAEMQ